MYVCGVEACYESHLQGLRGQHIELSVVDGGWHTFVKDHEDEIKIIVYVPSHSVRRIPEHGFIIDLAVMPEGHLLVVEVIDPSSASSTRCLDEMLPCLADCRLRVVVDGKVMKSLIGPNNDVHLLDGLVMSASNLPSKCHETGRRKVWTRAHTDLGHGHRQLAASRSFEDWILEFKNMVSI